MNSSTPQQGDSCTAKGTSTSGSSAPSSKTSEQGRDFLKGTWRSIIASQTSFLLFHGFHKQALGGSERTHPALVDVLADASSKVPDFMGLGKESAKHLLDTFENNKNERDLTDKLSDAIGKVVKDQLVVKTQLRIGAIASLRRGDLDVAFGKREKTTGGIPLVGFWEVGIANERKAKEAQGMTIDEMFWSKLGQSGHYLKLIRARQAHAASKTSNSQAPAFLHENLHKFVFDGRPILVGVLVVTKACDRGRLAIFVCDPKRSHVAGWRATLLWRREMSNRQEMAQYLGGFVESVKHLAANGERLKIEKVKAWGYKGPNCTKVTIEKTGKKEGESFVLRSYDNRVRQTSRSPEVYRCWEKIKGNTQDIVAWLDPSCEVIEFRDKEFYHEDLMFRADGRGGKLEVIAVPFYEGGHRCWTVDQARQVIEDLQALHKADFVHGDIRAWNIVFGAQRSCLIDFDFGGKTRPDLVYPTGYVDVLKDGARIGEEHQTIAKEHDIFALHDILGNLHRFIDVNTELDLTAMSEALVERPTINARFKLVLDKHGGDGQISETSTGETAFAAMTSPHHRRTLSEKGLAAAMQFFSRKRGRSEIAD